MTQATTQTTAPAPPLPEMKTDLHINGEWRPASDNGTTSVVNPATGETVCEVAKGTQADATAAVDAAQAAFENPEWRWMDPSKRGKLMFALADAVKARFNDFAVAEMLSNGKTMKEAQGDIGFVINTIRYHAGIADKIQGETVPVGPGRLDYTLKEPLGVTVHIAPWNYPLLLSVRSIAPALAAGNTIILKPASWTPLTALLFAEAAEAARFPPGVVNVVPGPGGAVGDTLVRDPRVESVTFTGSCLVGQEVMKAASETTKRTVLELGGKSPVVVFPDADIDKTVKGIGWGIFANAGQMCWAGSRLIVHEDIAEQVYDGLKAFAAKMTPKAGWDESARMGPLVHLQHRDDVMGYIQKGKAEGAKLLCGGEVIAEGVPAGGAFLQPTVFTDVTTEMTIWQQEIFGPVLACTTFKTEEEAIRLANETTFGLWSGIWTKDISTAHRVAAQIDAGMVGINEGPVTFPQTPFGGFKQSGLGTEQGLGAVDHYTRTKNVMVKL